MYGLFGKRTNLEHQQEKLSVMFWREEETERKMKKSLNLKLVMSESFSTIFRNSNFPVIRIVLLPFMWQFLPEQIQTGFYRFISSLLYYRRYKENTFCNKFELC